MMAGLGVSGDGRIGCGYVHYDQLCIDVFCCGSLCLLASTSGLCDRHTTTTFTTTTTTTTRHLEKQCLYPVAGGML